jgi:biopolymer transport protein ExbD
MSKIRELKADKERLKLSEKEFNQRLTSIKKDKSAPIVLIRATDESVYRNLIDALDEMAICNIERYAIDAITPFDLNLIETYHAENKHPNEL